MDLRFINKIDVTALREDERCELARLLFKSGYCVEPKRERVSSGSKYRYQIVIEKAGEK